MTIKIEQSEEDRMISFIYHYYMKQCMMRGFGVLDMDSFTKVFIKYLEKINQTLYDFYDYIVTINDRTPF